MNDLRKLAEEATPGPWGIGYWAGSCHRHELGKHPGPPACEYDYELVHDGEGETPVFDNPHHLVSLSQPGIVVTGNYDYEEGGVVEPKDAAYIAAASPDVILGLLDRIAVLEDGVRRMIEWWDGSDEPEDVQRDWIDPLRELVGLERLTLTREEQAARSSSKVETNG